MQLAVSDPMGKLPEDHAERMDRVRLALEGLSVGDALGEQFFDPASLTSLLPRHEVPL